MSPRNVIALCGFPSSVFIWRLRAKFSAGLAIKPEKEQSDRLVKSASFNILPKFVSFRYSGEIALCPGKDEKIHC